TCMRSAAVGVEREPRWRLGTHGHLVVFGWLSSACDHRTPRPPWVRHAGGLSNGSFPCLRPPCLRRCPALVSLPEELAPAVRSLSGRNRLSRAGGLIVGFGVAGRSLSEFDQDSRLHCGLEASSFRSARIGSDLDGAWEIENAESAPLAVLANRAR